MIYRICPPSTTQLTKQFVLLSASSKEMSGEDSAFLPPFMACTVSRRPRGKSAGRVGREPYKLAPLVDRLRSERLNCAPVSEPRNRVNLVICTWGELGNLWRTEKPRSGILAPKVARA
jgi:hypothetical protein